MFYSGDKVLKTRCYRPYKFQSDSISWTIEGGEANGRMYLRNLGALDLYAEYYATDYGELAERINQLLDSGADGWRKEGGSWYYYKNGAALKAQWLKDGGHWYWLGEDGAMATGWLSWQGKLYWLNPEQRESVPERGPASSPTAAVRSDEAEKEARTGLLLDSHRLHR